MSAVATDQNRADIIIDRPAVFLDRDGVLNRSDVVEGKPFAPRQLARFRLLPNTRRSVLHLKQAGFVVIVVTNQPDIGNGLVDPAEVEAMHRKLRQRVPVDDIRMCPHRREDGCHCRKPRPGMLLDAARDFGLDLSRSFMVGDRPGDIVAGSDAGCRTIFIDRGYCERLTSPADAVVGSLAGAVRRILAISACGQDAN